MTEQTERIWLEFHQRLRGYILKRIADPHEAEDILQEAFVRWMERPPQNRNPTGWLFTVVRNLIYDHHRKANRHENLEAESLPALDQTEVTEAEQRVASWLEPMLSLIPEKYAIAVDLAEFQNHSMKQVAEELDLSVPGAKSRVQRGRRLLAEALTDCCRFQFDREGRVSDWQRNHPKGCHPNRCRPEDTPQKKGTAC